MKVFLSWSGLRSQLLAKALHAWLPDVLQPVRPWLSSSDIEAGMRWASELELQLRESRVGIICLTPENLNAPWMLFEAGALSKSLGSTCVCPYLFDFSPEDLHGPLVQFQAVTATKEGTWKLVNTLNRSLGEDSIQDQRLERTFDRWWPDLDRILISMPPNQSKRNQPCVDKTDAAQNAMSSSVAERAEGVVRAFSGQVSSSETELLLPSQKIFLVHGHNELVREEVARFIERLGLGVIILSEQPSNGRTIIESFESFADVSYAVVLMTADDVGAPRGTKRLRQRVRQNVVFELGFFTAKLGRSKVTILFEEGLEMPGDFSGMLYVQLDNAGAWKSRLAKELKTAGLTIDLNKVL